jgi:hypothetical protein
MRPITLSLRPGQRLQIGGATLLVARVSGDRVRVEVLAPDGVVVRREPAGAGCSGGEVTRCECESQGQGEKEGGE